MSNDTSPAADHSAAPVETAGRYCCECGTFGTHEIKCQCCGFDFRSVGESEDVAE